MNRKEKGLNGENLLLAKWDEIASVLKAEIDPHTRDIKVQEGDLVL